jgi:hypothetical protein
MPIPMTHQSFLGRGASFSHCGRYRYALWRAWSRKGGRVVFILLNPSTADAERDDPTIRRCIGFARAWGFGSVEVVNLFAWRATLPADLRRASAPVGAGNARAVRRAVRRSRRVVLAWGNPGTWRGAGPALLKRLRLARVPLDALGWTLQGQPRHVLYLPRSTRPHRVR